MKTLKVLLSLAVLAFAAIALCAQRGPEPPPMAPFKVIGNIHFVGPESEHSSFLITTPQGNILINSGFDRQVPIIRSSVEKLGFAFKDIKIVLGSHAHNDHQEGDAQVKELTGAQVVAMEQDVPALRNMRPNNKPHPIDKLIHDLDEVKLGGTTLVAHLTPGHTKGCTTWTTKVQEGGKTYDVVIGCGVGATGRPLVNNKDYPEVIEDYMHAYQTMRTLPCDVFLSSHAGHYGLIERVAKMEKGGPNPFIDPTALKKHVDQYEKDFYTELEKQKQAAK